MADEIKNSRKQLVQQRRSLAVNITLHSKQYLNAQIIFC
jgi:hypothetical protein